MPDVPARFSGTAVNEIERLQGEIVAMSKRIARLEIIFQSRGVLSDDARQAEALAETLGFELEVIYLPASARPRKGVYARKRSEIVRRLHAEGWNNTRIARALSCADRTVERILSRQQPPGPWTNKGKKG